MWNLNEARFRVLAVFQRYKSILSLNWTEIPAVTTGMRGREVLHAYRPSYGQLARSWRITGFRSDLVPVVPRISLTFQLNKGKKEGRIVVKE